MSGLGKFGQFHPRVENKSKKESWMLAKGSAGLFFLEICIETKYMPVNTLSELEKLTLARMCISY